MKHFVADSYYRIIIDVTKTWDQLKVNPEYRKDVGVELFTRMFLMAPDVWNDFSWGGGIKKGEKLIENEKFVAFAGVFVGMLDMAINMLGPKLDLVELELQELGVRHIAYDVMPKHYPLTEKALVDTLKHQLGKDSFTPQHEESWNTIFTFMSITMMQGAFQKLADDQRDFRKLKAAKKQQDKIRIDSTPHVIRKRGMSLSSNSSTGAHSTDDSTASSRSGSAVTGGAFGAIMKRLVFKAKK